MRFLLGVMLWAAWYQVAYALGIDMWRAAVLGGSALAVTQMCDWLGHRKGPAGSAE